MKSVRSCWLPSWSLQLRPTATVSLATAWFGGSIPYLGISSKVPHQYYSIVSSRHFYLLLLLVKTYYQHASKTESRNFNNRSTSPIWEGSKVEIEQGVIPFCLLVNRGMPVSFFPRYQPWEILLPKPLIISEISSDLNFYFLSIGMNKHHQLIGSHIINTSSLWPLRSPSLWRG